MTTAGIGVITSRASCSCRWKTPVSIVASFSSMSPWLPEVWISERRSSTSWCSSIDSGLIPKRRTSAFEAVESPHVNGADIKRNQCSGRATSRAVGSARWIATIFGTCSPTVMCRAVAIAKASASAIAVAAPWANGPCRAGSSSAAIAGSPRKPMPSEAIVMPSWQAAR